ncbi:hypothetical protein PDUR_26190 [Paenibacillus durus]|uniref:Uncharacterized protein n=1 Tax=Paenibacillus durus TaxID=44251 RepID=A0A089J1B7_PAEDU|nr:hypothetical protein PDUR_26190 [Paenibacillus durus]
MPSGARMSSRKDLIAGAVHHVVYDTNEVVWRKVLLQVHWQMKLIHAIVNVQKKPSFGMVTRHFHFTKERLLFVLQNGNKGDPKSHLG